MQSVRKLVFAIFMLSRLRNLIAPHIMLRIYQCIIQPILDYAITVGPWGFTSQLNLSRVQRLQKRAARIITGNFDYINVRGIDILMLISHCGEYMANGLTNAVRHEFVMIANDRQTFVAVRKHSQSFLWCFECYAGLTSGECMANGLTNAIRHQFAMIAKWSPDMCRCS